MKKYKNETQNIKTQMAVRECCSLKEGGFEYCGIKPCRYCM